MKGPVGELPSYFDYADTAENNIFHPERKILKGEEAAQQRPEIVLYGTLIMDDVKLAYLEDKHKPVTTPGRGKRQMVVKEGGSVNGYILREVNKDNIVLVRGTDRIIVTVYDGSKSRSSPDAPAGTAVAAGPALAAEKKAAAERLRNLSGQGPRPESRPTSPAPLNR
jgi:hypothetical protein